MLDLCRAVWSQALAYFIAQKHPRDDRVVISSFLMVSPVATMWTTLPKLMWIFFSSFFLFE
jgi:hypothetical protein